MTDQRTSDAPRQRDETSGAIGCTSASAGDTVGPIARITRYLGLILLAASLSAPSVDTTRAASAPAPEPFGKAPTLRSTPVAEVRAAALAWLDQHVADPAKGAQGASLWDPNEELLGIDLLERLVATLALGDDRAGQLVEICRHPHRPGALPDQAWLLVPETPPLVAHNLRLWYGRWLAQQDLYDEALGVLDGLDPTGVVDPATLLFYQGVVYHRLLKREPGLTSIRRLLDDVADSPERYTALAGLMEADLRGLEDDSLDHIARRMDDIRRRLDLGRAGPKTREVEDGVIASLDKLIQELEEQQQQQQQANASGGSRSRNPAQDSQILPGQGPGEVTRRDIGHGDGWGDLPPKERDEALQQIGKDFPSHYRDVVEQYFRKLASEPSAKPGE